MSNFKVIIIDPNLKGEFKKECEGESADELLKYLARDFILFEDEKANGINYEGLTWKIIQDEGIAENDAIIWGGFTVEGFPTIIDWFS